MSVVKIEVITYDQERLNYFTDLMKRAQKRYDRLYKKFANSPYLWEETELLNDAGRELQFYKDVIALLEKSYRKRSEGCEFCGTPLYVKTIQYTMPLLAPITRADELRNELLNLTGERYLHLEAKYCPLCGAKMKGATNES